MRRVAKQSNGIRKPRRKVPAARLEQFVEEAVEAHRSKQEILDRKFGDIVRSRVTYRGRPDDDLIPDQVEKSLPIDSVKEELEWRLREISYPFPFPKNRKTTHTINDYIQKRGIMGIVAGPVILDLARSVWTLAEIRGLRERLHKEKKSAYMHPMTFHRSMIRQIAAHLEAIDLLTTNFQVPHGWIAEYRHDILRALLKEAVILRPELQRQLRISAEAKAVDITTQVQLFKAIDQELRKNGISSSKFASHLTAVICSSLSSILDGKLKPSPDTIRLHHGRSKVINEG